MGSNYFDIQCMLYFEGGCFEKLGFNLWFKEMTNCINIFIHVVGLELLKIKKICRPKW